MSLYLCLSLQMNQFGAWKGNYTKETFSASDNLASNVLGQHGLQLLMERSDSFFLPGIAGMICIGTKVGSGVVF